MTVREEYVTEMTMKCRRIIIKYTKEEQTAADLLFMKRMLVVLH